MKKKSKIIEVNFNPQNKLTSARAHEIAKESRERLRRLFKEKRYEDPPGPECLSDFEILSYENRHPRFYWTKKMQQFEKHILNCDRCGPRSYWLLGVKEYPF